MELTVERRDGNTDRTIGQMFVDGWFECFTLEDPVRLGIKIAGATAIPIGRYEVRLRLSPRFGRIVPYLIGVLAFADIEIHAGNTADDTRGCILVGTARGSGQIVNSRMALNALVPKISRALDAQDLVWITVENADTIKPLAA